MDNLSELLQKRNAPYLLNKNCFSKLRSKKQTSLAGTHIGGILHFACGKLIVRRNGRRFTVHVMDKIWNHIMVRLTSNEVVNQCCPQYEEIFIDKNRIGWYFVLCQQAAGKVVTSSNWTIIFYLTQKEELRYIFRPIYVTKNSNKEQSFY